MTSHSRTPRARVCRGSAALVALCALAASCHIPSTRSARPLGSHVPSIGVQAGYRYFTNDTLWAPDKQQPTVGASLDWRNVDGGLGFSVGGYASRSESGGRQDTTLEPYFGIRWDLGDWTTRLRPYLGVGYSWIFARQEQAGRTVTDDSLAGNASAGFLFDVTEAFAVGFDMRALYWSELTLGGERGHANYVQGALVLAFGF